MKNPKITVILSVYNGEKYLKKALDSIINQSLKDIEIILINDGSQDSSLKILKEYEKTDSRIKIINNEKNLGLGTSRNIGLSIAKGEYISFVDCDDWIKKKIYEVSYSEAIKYNSDITMFQTANYDENDKTFHLNDWSNLNQLNDSFYNRSFNSDDTKKFLFKLPVSACQKIYRREFLNNKNIRFPDRIYFEDNPFFYKTWLQAERISIIKHHYYIRRVHNDSITGTCDEKFFDIIPSGIELANFIIENGYYREYKEDFINYRIDAFRLVMKCMKYNLKEKFYKLSKKEFNRILNSPYKKDYLKYMNKKNKKIFKSILETENFTEFDKIWPPSKVKNSKG